MTVKNRYHISDDKFREAIIECAGMKSEIARKLGCTWPTVHNRIKASEELQQLMEDATERTLDRAEKIIGKNLEILDKDQDETQKTVSTDDAKWYLERKGKHKGYAQRTEMTGADGVAITVSISIKE